MAFKKVVIIRSTIFSGDEESVVSICQKSDNIAETCQKLINQFALALLLTLTLLFFEYHSLSN